MCVAIPMRVLHSQGLWAECEGRGTRRRVNLMLVGERPAGTWLLVLGDSARQCVDADEAARVDSALDAVEAAMRGEQDLAGYFADLDGMSSRSGSGA